MSLSDPTSSHSRLRLFIAALVLLGTTGAALAQAIPPSLVNYQGVLRDNLDNPITGTKDIVFQLYSVASAGSAILVDSHLASGSGAVSVNGGLFNTTVGGGALADGADVAGPGNCGPGCYTSLAAVLRDFNPLYLEVQVNGEILSPRTRLVSVPYSLNSDSLGGKSASAYAQLAGSNTFTAGTQTLQTGGPTTKGLVVKGATGQTVSLQEWQDGSGATVATVGPSGTFNVNGGLDLNGTIRMDDDGPDGDQSVHFYNGGNPVGEHLQWSDARDRFEFSDELALAPVIRVGNTAATPVTYNHFGLGGTPDSGDMTTSSDLYVENDLEIDETLYLNGAIRMDDDGPDGNQAINFYNAGSATAESFAWTDANDRFELSDELAIVGPFSVGNILNTPINHNRFATGTLTSSGAMNGLSDLYIQEDLEVDGFVYFDGVLRMDDDGPDGNQFIYFFEDGLNNGEVLTWEDANDRFSFSDDLHVIGNLSATGTKPFVQNHPYRNDLSVVYVALEGDEAGTYTRGSARLSNGVTHVSLDQSFAWVTNPDIGLTAHVTPRGGWADLYVESVSASELVVRSRDGSAADTAFDYIVHGLRIGFEEWEVVQPRASEAPIPSMEYSERPFRKRPELRPYTPLERFRRMRKAVAGDDASDLSASLALRGAIGEYEPDSPASPRSEPSDESGRASQTHGGRQPSGSADSLAASQPGADPHAGSSPHTEREGAPMIHPVVGDPGAGRPRIYNGQPGTPIVLGYPIEGIVESGDVVVATARGPLRLERAAAATDPGVVGIVWETPDVKIGDADVEATVAVSGIVPCKVDAGYGAIRRGDLLATSPTPGHAMRSVDQVPGTIVGKALEPLESGTGLICVLATLR